MDRSERGTSNAGARSRTDLANRNPGSNRDYMNTSRSNVVGGGGESPWQTGHKQPAGFPANQNLGKAGMRPEPRRENGGADTSAARFGDLGQEPQRGQDAVNNLPMAIADSLNALKGAGPTSYAGGASQLLTPAYERNAGIGHYAGSEAVLFSGAEPMGSPNHQTGFLCRRCKNELTVEDLEAERNLPSRPPPPERSGYPVQPRTPLVPEKLKAKSNEEAVRTEREEEVEKVEADTKNGDLVDLERCLAVLIKTKTGTIREGKLLDKVDLGPDRLDELYEEFPGILAEKVSKDEKGKKLRMVELLPVFHLCRRHVKGGKRCHDKRCRKLHVCKEYILDGSCNYSSSRSRRSGTAECPRGHSLETAHNLRVLRKQLEIPDLSKFSSQFIENLVAFCVNDDGSGSEDSGSSSGEEYSREKKGRSGDKSARARSDSQEGQVSQKPGSAKSKSRRGNSRSDSEDDRGSRKHGSTTGASGKTKFVGQFEDRSQSPQNSMWRGNSGRGGMSESFAGGAALRGNAAASVTPQPVICTLHAEGKRCDWRACGKVHGPQGKLYQWQVMAPIPGGVWLNLSDRHSDFLESSFEKPEVERVPLSPWNPMDQSSCTYPVGDASKLLGNVPWVADLQKMCMELAAGRTGGGGPLALRRVGAYPRIKGRGDTKWVWYFLDNKGNWVAYGKKAEAVYDTGVTTKSDLSSDDIEEHFVNGIVALRGVSAMASPETAALSAVAVVGMKPLQFCTGYHDYQLDFTRMVQINIGVGTEREIRRRPAPGSIGGIFQSFSSLLPQGISSRFSGLGLGGKTNRN